MHLHVHPLSISFVKPIFGTQNKTKNLKLGKQNITNGLLGLEKRVTSETEWKDIRES